MMKKTASLILAAVMIFTASIATAKTVEPESTETNGLAGVTVHATVGEYDMGIYWCTGRSWALPAIEVRHTCLTSRSKWKTSGNYRRITVSA